MQRQILIYNLSFASLFIGGVFCILLVTPWTLGRLFEIVFLRQLR